MIPQSQPCQPILKWPGGKRALLPYLLPMIPDTINTYYEPFVGGGAVFFACQPESALLSDQSEELINCYIQVRDNVENLLTALLSMKNTEKEYYRIRSMTPYDPIDRASRLIYLMTLSFNGLYRVNLRGQFNVPYGHKTDLPTIEPGRLRAVSAVLSGSRLICSDFEVALQHAGPGDFVYLDPPYTVAHGHNSFLKYNARIFSWDDQRRLANLASELDRRGCRVLASNADHPSVRSLYAGFDVVVVTRPSRIAASSAHRRPVTECIFYNGGV